VENALLYTFSTVAQALGGMFALLAAFVLYRSQSLESMMGSDSRLLMTMWASSQSNEENLHHELAGQGRFREVYENIKAAVADLPVTHTPYQPYGSHGQEPFNRLGRMIEVQENLTRYFIRAAWLTGATILGSVAAIPFAQILRCHHIIAAEVLFVGIAAFAACIWSYWVVISAALGLGKKKPVQT
jgi:hypothetical protein